jgi:hypothetical protein
MRDELEERLYAAFPDLYSQHTLDTTQSRMCDGFSHGDGWFRIILELSTKLASIIEADPKVDPKTCTVSQVKEKFGTPRYYMHRSTPEMMKAIGEAEAQSGITCETCGQDGRLRGEDWLRTLCDKCEGKREKEMQRRKERWAKSDYS